MSTILELNHVALHVRDVTRSVVFYKDIVGLLPMPRPDLGFPGAWFRVGQTQELHLLAGLDYEVQSGSRKNHFALWVDYLQPLADKIKTFDLETIGPKTRADGVWQFFVKDPDDYWVEISSNHL